MHYSIQSQIHACEYMYSYKEWSEEVYAIDHRLVMFGLTVLCLVKVIYKK